MLALRMGDALLTYSVEPTAVPCSASDTQLSVVDVTIMASNGTGLPVHVSEIDFEIAGGGWQAPQSLTWDPTSIAAVPGDATPWAICGDDDGHWRAFPLPPSTDIAEGQAISFVFSGVVVNQAPYQSPGAVLSVVETSGAGSGSASVTVQKTQAVGPYGGLPKIDAFKVDQPQIAPGETVTFAWEVENVDVDGSCQLTAGSGGAPVPLSPPGGGTLQLAVSETTTFTLDAIGSGGIVSELLTVTVMPVQLTLLTATPATVAAEQQVTLAWEANYALTCSIDQGVGPVAVTGAITVTPTQTTVYTITANGLDPQQSSVEVTVDPPT